MLNVTQVLLFKKQLQYKCMGHVFLVAWGYWRPAGLLEHPWAYLNKSFGGGPKEVYADFFGILTSVEDATNDRLEREIESG